MKIQSDRAQFLYDSINDESDIRALIDQDSVETNYVDYKLAKDGGTKLDQSVKNNLGKAVSGFGNTAGGIVVWGVRCDSRINDDKPFDDPDMRIGDPAAFTAKLYGEISGCTFPVHTEVECKPIVSGDGSGWVVMLVPICEKRPLRCLHGKEYYYQRAGSEFQPLDHNSLSALFGRPVPPNLYIRVHEVGYSRPGQGDNYWLNASIRFRLGNKGPGLAKYPFVQIEREYEKGVCNFNSSSHWSKLLTTGGLVADKPSRLGPGQEVMLGSLLMQLPARIPLTVRFSWGAEGTAIWRSTYSVDPKELTTPRFGEFEHLFLETLFPDAEPKKHVDGLKFIH